MSNPMTLRTNRRVWDRLYTANSTTLGTFNAVSATAPTTALSCTGSNLAKIMVFGQGTSATKENYTVISGYSPMPDDAASTNNWVPSFICKLKWTWAGGTQMAGLAGKLVTDSDNFAETVALTSGDTSIRLITGAVTEAASVTIDLEGASMIGVAWDGTGVTEPTNWNALVGLF